MWQLLALIWCPPLVHSLCYYALEELWLYQTEAACREQLDFMIFNKPGLFYYGWCVRRT